MRETALIDGQLEYDMRIAGPLRLASHSKAALASSKRKVEMDVVLDGFPAPGARRLHVFPDSAAGVEHVIAGHTGGHWDARLAWSQPQPEFAKKSLDVEAEDAKAVLGGDFKIHDPRLTVTCALDDKRSPA